MSPSRAALSALFSVVLAGAAAAQYPSKPVTIVVPYGPGGGNDITARFYADKLTALWKQPVVIENRPGAGTAIGSTFVSRANPDGHVLLFTSVTYTTMAAVQKNLPFNPEKDLQPVAMVGKVPLGMAGGPKTPVATVRELIEAGKSKRLLYSTAGPGSINQFAAELLNTVAGMQSEPIHYASGNEAITSLMGGHVDFYFGSLLQVETFVTSGKVKGLMITSPERVKSVPDVPTPAEAGVAGAEVELWWGIFAPSRTAPTLVREINAAFVKVMQDPATVAFLAKGGARPTPITPEAFSKEVADELVKWRKIAERAGITLN